MCDPSRSTRSSPASRPGLDGWRHAIRVGKCSLIRARDVIEISTALLKSNPESICSYTEPMP